MLEIAAWILLAIAAIVAAFWFAFVRIPSLEVTANATPGELAEAVDDWARTLETKRRFNGVMLLVHDGETVLAEGYGATDHTRTSRLTTRSSMRLASLSKQFTAAAMLRLVDEGRAALDDEVTQHVARFPFARVTIRQLMNHTSGIPDVYMAMAKARKDRIDVLTNADVAQMLRDEPPRLRHEPGHAFEYSNTNYVLLAHTIEEISGTSLEEFLEAEVIAPLGMERTRVWNQVSKIPPGDDMTGGMNVYAAEPGKGAVLPGFLDGVSGDGAVHSSAGDMAIWNRFWIDGAGVLDPELVALAQQPTSLPTGRVSNYGFGWCVDGDEVWHNGRWLAANSYFRRGRDGRSALFVVDNGGTLSFQRIVDQLRHVWSA